MTNMGERIHALRIHKDMTLQELGDKVGVGASTVRKWETGYIKTLRTDKVKKLAAALDTTTSYLMGWEDNSINVNGTNNNVVNNNSGSVNIGDAISVEERELLRIYRELPVKARMELLNNAFTLEANNK